MVGRQMGERKMKAIAFGINVEAQKDGFWQATAGKGNYVATLDTYAEVEMTPKMIPFVKAFKARFNKAPTYNAGTYDAIDMLKRPSRRRAPSKPTSSSPSSSRSKFVGSGAYLEYDKAHDPVWGIGKDTGIARAVAGRKEGAVLAADGEGDEAVPAARVVLVSPAAGSPALRRRTARPRRCSRTSSSPAWSTAASYALLAIGFSLIFGVARIVNIAHTAFYMLAAYCALHAAGEVPGRRSAAGDPRRRCAVTRCR